MSQVGCWYYFKDYGRAKKTAERLQKFGRFVTVIVTKGVY